jgi:DNA-binding beta-propeller fold protein YncE
MMRKTVISVTALAVAFVLGFLIAGKRATVQGQAPAGFSAVPGQKGGQDIFGPYEVVADWPKLFSSMPGHENWTWGAVQGVFAESPNRIFIVQRGELPRLTRPPGRAIPEIGPSLSFPVGQAPFRNASQGPASSPPGAGGPGADPDDPAQAWRGRMGIDARWEHTVVVVNAAGDFVEDWTQWDSKLKRPHAVYINPYDAQKHVWIVDDHNHALFKFTNDGKQLVQTVGTPGQKGADGTHFNRPTFMAWLPDSSFYVADGYNGTRVAKFDKDGKFLLAWGERGTPPDTRPNHFNTVHGVAVDPQTRRVFVSDRSNRRIQVFDENGRFLDQWSGGPRSSPQFLHIGADRVLWMPDNGTWKIVGYTLEGQLVYAWGSQGDFPGGMWNVHGLSVDQEGNLYIAEVGNGRPQKFRPRPNANPAYMVGKPAYSAWR